MPARRRKPASKAVGRPFAKGEDSRRNTTKPGPGRPPDAFKELCRELASGETTVEQVKLILQDRTDVKFVACLRWATENGYGKAKETVEHQGGVTLRIEYGDSDE